MNGDEAMLLIWYAGLLSMGSKLTLLSH